MAVTHTIIIYLDLLIKKYILISSFIYLVRGICPNHPDCECTPNYINCTCLGTDDTIFVTQSTNRFDGKEFIISKCNKVEVEKLSMNHLDLEFLQFSELNELNIQSYSLSESSIKIIVMSNINFLQLESYSLSDVKDCINLEIINASVENFPPAAVGGIKVKSINIKDCHIGTIHSRAFSLSNIEKFTLENNYINTFDITSVVIRNAKEFNFIRNAVTASSFGTFSLAEIDIVEINHSTFRQIHSSMIITKEVKSFSFHDCYVETCESRAFWSIEVKESLTFSRNEIKFAEDDSLLPNLGPAIFDHNVNIEINHNLLTCECHLDWIWKETSLRYELLRKGSVCYAPQELEGKSLSKLTLSVDNANNCISINEKVEIRNESYSTQSIVISTKPTKKSNISNTKRPKSTLSKSTTKFIASTKSTKKASFITDASAEKQGIRSDSIKLYFCNILIIISLILIGI